MHRASVPFATLLALVAVGARAQAPAVSPFPTTFGTHWVYGISSRSGTPQPSPTRTVTCEVGCDGPNGNRLHQMRIEATGGGPAAFGVFSARSDGIYRLATKDPTRRGAVDLAAVPMRLLALPVGSPATWQWRGPLVGDHAADAAEWSHRGEWLGPVSVEVPAGTFRADHVRITSERPEHSAQTLDLWFAPDVGIVREVHGDGERIVELREFSFAADATARVVRHVESELKNPRIRSFNNAPKVTWLEAGPETLLLPGPIAIAHTDAWSACYFVGEQSVHWFDPREADLCAAAIRAAFGTKSAALPADMSPRSLALLLARSHAARLQLGRVREVPTTLEPKPPRRPVREGSQTAHIEVLGGTLDGNEQRIAVWLTLAPFAEIRVVSDGAAPRDPFRLD